MDVHLLDPETAPDPEADHHLIDPEGSSLSDLENLERLSQVGIMDLKI